jgi:hypothetical protein
MSSAAVETASPVPAAAESHPLLTTEPALWTTNLTASSLSTASGNSCLDEQIERLKRCEYLREGEVKALCLRAREILVDESNVQRVDAPVTVSTSDDAIYSVSLLA